MSTNYDPKVEAAAHKPKKISCTFAATLKHLDLPLPY